MIVHCHARWNLFIYISLVSPHGGGGQQVLTPEAVSSPKNFDPSQFENWDNNRFCFLSTENKILEESQYQSRVESCTSK